MVIFERVNPRTDCAFDLLIVIDMLQELEARVCVISGYLLSILITYMRGGGPL